MFMCRFYTSQTHVLVQPLENLSRVQVRTLSTANVFLQDQHRPYFPNKFSDISIYLQEFCIFLLNVGQIHISLDGPLTAGEMFLKFRIETDLCKTVPVETGIVSDWPLISHKINYLGYCYIYLPFEGFHLQREPVINKIYAIKINIIILV